MYSLVVAYLRRGLTPREAVSTGFQDGAYCIDAPDMLAAGSVQAWNVDGTYYPIPSLMHRNAADSAGSSHE